jgi:hypothetical protein
MVTLQSQIHIVGKRNTSTYRVVDIFLQGEGPAMDSLRGLSQFRELAKAFAKLYPARTASRPAPSYPASYPAPSEHASSSATRYASPASAASDLASAASASANAASASAASASAASAASHKRQRDLEVIEVELKRVRAEVRESLINTAECLAKYAPESLACI